MKKLLYKVYKCYDSLKEPWRFILFFVPLIILVIGSYSGIIILSIACICLLMFFFITRFIYIFGKDIGLWYEDLLEQIKIIRSNKNEHKRIDSE